MLSFNALAYSRPILNVCLRKKARPTPQMSDRVGHSSLAVQSCPKRPIANRPTGPDHRTDSRSHSTHHNFLAIIHDTRKAARHGTANQSEATVADRALVPRHVDGTRARCSQGLKTVHPITTRKHSSQNNGHIPAGNLKQKDGFMIFASLHGILHYYGCGTGKHTYDKGVRDEDRPAIRK